MNKYQAQNVISGSSGEVWIDSDYMAEVTALEAKASLDKQEVTQIRSQGSKGYKVMGIDGKGTLKFNKVDSYFIKRLSDDLKRGKTTVFTIISKLDDPDVNGQERIKLSGVIFDELSLVNWEAGKLNEESMAFTFTDWEPLDTI